MDELAASAVADWPVAHHADAVPRLPPDGRASRSIHYEEFGFR
jgi:hypothetical protein